MSAKVRGIAHANAANASGTPLTVASQPGDTAVIIASAQLAGPAQPYSVPDGWQGNAASPIAGTNRSGYVAYRKVTASSQTAGVEWYNKDAGWTARQNAVMVVFEGELEIRVTDWQTTIPTVGEDTYIASQSHGPMTNKLMEWTVAGDILYDGLDSVSTNRSWSAIRFGVTSQPPGNMGEGQIPNAWCAFTAKVAFVATPGASWYQNGSEVPARVSVYENDSEKQATRLGVMPKGPSTLAELYRIPNFVVAHRGGSSSWTESTQQAYTNSMAYGMDALEISCARTSDGVWFANHDNNLKALGGPDKNTSNMTWAEVVDAMKGMPDKMPCRLDWLLEKYGDDTVIVFDPKNNHPLRDEYFGILEPYKERVLIKFFGDLISLFDDARSRGFGAWGYAYEPNKTATWWKDFVSGEHLDVLSMSWTASQEVYDQLKVSGKPIVSHITGQPSHAEAAAKKGATGTIASGVSKFKPIQV